MKGCVFIQTNKRYLCIGSILFVILCTLALWQLHLGAMKIELSHVWGIVWSHITHKDTVLPYPANEIAVIWDIRLPRILCGILVGAGLATAGTIFQAILRNPLADPYTLGVSTGAAFGASVAILFQIILGVYFPITVFSMFFAFFTLLLVLFIANRGGGFASQNLVISGIIVSSILSSGISFLKMAAGENVGAIVFWLMGSLSSRQWMDVALLSPIVTFGILIAFYFADDLDIMVLGDETALSLGVNTTKLRLIYLVIGACITAACVAVSGVIGFIGLVVPHLLRFRLSASNRILIPLAAFSGGILLSIADFGARFLFSGELPVGVLTTLIGGPFFIYIFIRREKYVS